MTRCRWPSRRAGRRRGSCSTAIAARKYTASDFTALLAGHEIRQSLSRPRQCWDNAVAESWFATLKRELIYRHSWPTRAEARRAIFEFIEVFYNRQRLHS